MSNNNLYAVILAGGSGTRFWPLSRRNKPKQFLKILGSDTFFQKTIARVRPLIAPSKIFIVTNSIYKKEVSSQIARFKIPSANILSEPSGKNTAPAIAWAAQKIKSLNPHAILAILPSDHLITKPVQFLVCFKQAVRLAQHDFLVTFGIQPTRPETGYGYLKTSIRKKDGLAYSHVDQFVEKPILSKAKEFLRKGNYLWNSGMFVWKADTILRAFAKDLPLITALLRPGTSQANIQRVWPKMPAISIDYGILEKSKNVVAVKAKNIGWSDVGSWESLIDVLDKDANGNILHGAVLPLESRQMYVRAGRRLVVTVGLKDMVIVDTEDALLVCPKDQSQKIKDVVSWLSKKSSPHV